MSLNGQDISRDCLTEDKIKTRPSGAAAWEVGFAAAADGGARFRLKYDGRKLPFLQTLRNAHEGINVFCIEPATHDRLPRKELREMEALASTLRGGSHMFHLEMLFDSGK